MATLVAIGYPDQGTAEQAMQTVEQLEAELDHPGRPGRVDLSRPRGQVPRPYHSRRRVRRRRRDLGRLLGPAVRAVVLHPVRRARARRRDGRAVRPHGREGDRQGVPGAGARLRQAGHLGAVHGDRAGDAGQGDRGARAVRRDGNQDLAVRRGHQEARRKRFSSPRARPRPRRPTHRRPAAAGACSRRQRLHPVRKEETNGCSWSGHPPDTDGDLGRETPTSSRRRSGCGRSTAKAAASTRGRSRWSRSRR